MPTSVTASDPTHVVIKTVEHDFHAGDDACSGDLAPTTSVVTLPRTVEPARILVIDIDGTTTRLTE